MLVGGMVAFGAHKMSEHHAQQIQEHTGIPPEELEDEDLAAAMQELGIPQQELTDEDRAAERAPTSPVTGVPQVDLWQCRSSR
jgi:hypothetical protein